MHITSSADFGDLIWFGDRPGNAVPRRKEVVMSIASASPSEGADAPVWRSLIANLGAGAVAGCTVEAGDRT